MEVRFENLHIETEAYAETSRQLPSLWNAARASIEVRSVVSLCKSWGWSCRPCKLECCHLMLCYTAPWMEKRAALV